MTFGSLFAGIGGFDLGFERAGMECRWQFETNKQARMILKRHFQTNLYGDVREALRLNLEAVDIICGGDPCPVRSKAKGNRKTMHPDLSGYFLALVGRMRPRWMVRENVPASDDKNFATSMEMLGYRTVIIRANSYEITGQNRTRDFIIGCAEKARMRQFIKLCQRQSIQRKNETFYKNEAIHSCLTTKRFQYGQHESYIWDESGKMRVADKDERTKLAGFPDGWLDGLSESAVARLTGNAIIPQIAEWFGKRIMDIEKENHGLCQSE